MSPRHARLKAETLMDPWLTPHAPGNRCSVRSKNVPLPDAFGPDPPLLIGQLEGE
jgi:hypothetical protein